MFGRRFAPVAAASLLFVGAGSAQEMCPELSDQDDVKSFSTPLLTEEQRSKVYGDQEVRRLDALQEGWWGSIEVPHHFRLLDIQTDSGGDEKGLQPEPEPEPEPFQPEPFQPEPYQRESEPELSKRQHAAAEE